jgi:hypothetical protein
VCCATERVLVHERAHDAFVEAVLAEPDAVVRLGDPTDPYCASRSSTGCRGPAAQHRLGPDRRQVDGRTPADHPGIVSTDSFFAPEVHKLAYGWGVGNVETTAGESRAGESPTTDLASG